MMNISAYTPRGRYFEEFELGQKLSTAGRTITEGDIVTFAGLSGDYNQIHTNAIFAAEDSFGRRVAHGLLVQSIAVGLSVQTGFIEGTVLAFRELTCKFSLPVYIGDTISVQLEIAAMKALPRLDGGQIEMKYSVVNQDGKAVQRGTWTMLVKNRPDEQ